MDIGHAGWLGWEGNRQRAAKIYKEVLDQAGGADKIRGFVTNISNYNTVNSLDGKKLGPSNPCPDELTYAKKLNELSPRLGVTGKKFVIDTSRNGRPTRSLGAVGATSRLLVLGQGHRRLQTHSSMPTSGSSRR